MTSRALDLVSSLMTSVDGVKDKLNDGDYLNLCNLLMALNTEIKSVVDDPYRVSEAEESEAEEDDDLEQTLHNPTIQLDERIKIMIEWLNNTRITRGTKEIVFNNYLRRLSVEEEESDFNRWFICGCGCSVHFSSIQDHLENHPNNFL